MTTETTDRFADCLAAHGRAPLQATELTTLQVNVGKLCNQACRHCHVDAGPHRTEAEANMDAAVADEVIRVLGDGGFHTVDLTGGAPELNPSFRRIVRAAHAAGVRVLDRCNLSVLFEPGQEDLADFLAGERVEIVASMPCYLEQNVDAQRGKGVFDGSIRGLQRLNSLGYGHPESGLVLNLVYNPQGPSLPPPQESLQADYKRVLGERYGIVFNRLYTLANMPIQRFGAILLAQGTFDTYLDKLTHAHRDENLDTVMCASLVSVDYTGVLYDCDFNQMLGLPLRLDGRPRAHLSDLLQHDTQGGAIRVADHCYGCTAGQGSSCGGALLAA